MVLNDSREHWGSTIHSSQLITRTDMVVQLLVFRRPRHIIMLPTLYHVLLNATSKAASLSGSGST